MKKKLAMALATIMVLAVVPAQWIINALACVSPSHPNFYVCMDDDADVLDDGEISDFGSRVLGADDNTIIIPVIWQNLIYYNADTGAYEPWDSGNWGSATAPQPDESFATTAFFNFVELKFSDPVTEALFEVKTNPATAAISPQITLEPHDIGVAKGQVWIEYRHSDRSTNISKKYDINGVIVDPTVNKAITGLTDKKLTDLGAQLNNRDVSETDLMDLQEIKTGSIIKFQLNTEFFEWDPLIEGMASSVRKSTLDNNHVGLKVRYKTGTNLIESAQIENIKSVAWVVVEFVDTFPSVKEQPFELTVNLSYKKKFDKEREILISGTLCNETMDILGGEDYAYLGDGTVIEVDELTRKIELDLGNGVSIYRTVQQKGKYYGVATDERTRGDQEIIDYYPSITRVLNLTTVNLSDSTGTPVKITPIYKNAWGIIDPTPTDAPTVYYAYDKNGKYLGSTDDFLPYRDKYYLSTRLLTDITMPSDEEAIGLDGAGESAESADDALESTDELAKMRGTSK